MFQTLELALNACHELDNSVEFLEVLRYVLAIGNYLNAGTQKGNAYGFQLKYLPKVSILLLYTITYLNPHRYIHNTMCVVQLIEFRGQEKTSLLDFLVQQLHIRKPNLLSMPSTLEAVAKASESLYYNNYISVLIIIL